MKKIIIQSALLSMVALAPLLSQAQEEVNVYSYRQEYLIAPLLQEFTAQSGIKVNTIYAKDGVVEKIKIEGKQSPADVLLTVDIGRLSDAVEQEVTQPVESDIINSNIPENFRDPNNQWFGLTSRARIIAVSKERVHADEITSYADLADPKWQGRICTRSGKHPYMVALTASIIARDGEEKAQQWLEGVKANLARKPEGNDRGQVKAIKEGVCDVAVINSYYMGKMLADPEQIAWAESVNIIFPDQQGHGTHINLSGMAMAKYAPNKESAQKLMEFLTEDKAQAIYAEDNFEYPLKEGTQWSELLNSWGQFKADDLSLATVAAYRSQASKLADVVGYDQ